MKSDPDPLLCIVSPGALSLLGIITYFSYTKHIQHQSTSVACPDGELVSTPRPIGKSDTLPTRKVPLQCGLKEYRGCLTVAWANKLRATWPFTYMDHYFPLEHAQGICIGTQTKTQTFLEQLCAYPSEHYLYEQVYVSSTYAHIIQ